MEHLENAECGKYGCKNPAEASHTCPFMALVHDDEEFKCQCCEKCEMDCADNV